MRSGGRIGEERKNEARRSREANERKKKVGWWTKHFFFPLSFSSATSAHFLKKKIEDHTLPSYRLLPLRRCYRSGNCRALSYMIICEGKEEKGGRRFFLLVKCEILFMAKRVEVSRRFFLRLVLLFFSYQAYSLFSSSHLIILSIFSLSLSSFPHTNQVSPQQRRASFSLQATASSLTAASSSPQSLSPSLSLSVSLSVSFSLFLALCLFLSLSRSLSLSL